MSFKNSHNFAHFGQNTGIFEAKATYFHAKHGLWPSRPTPKGQIWS